MDILVVVTLCIELIAVQCWTYESTVSALFYIIYRPHKNGVSASLTQNFEFSN